MNSMSHVVDNTLNFHALHANFDHELGAKKVRLRLSHLLAPTLKSARAVDRVEFMQDLRVECRRLFIC
jgi:hypothetical protein